ncbi:MAG TPA: hypothetical protein VGV15_06520 [Terriglobales bacterium]|nr:hypothetical protein [Terriglobales bacterium]
MSDFDSFEKISQKLNEHEEKFSNQYDETLRLRNRVSELERKLKRLEESVRAA